MTFAQLDGLPQLVDGLHDAALNLGRLQPVNTEAVELVARTAQARAPRRIGTLALGHHVVADDTGGTLRNDTRYALPVHAGWQRGGTVVAGRPWIADAFASDESSVVDLYQAHVQSQIGKV